MKVKVTVQKLLLVGILVPLLALVTDAARDDLVVVAYNSRTQVPLLVDSIQHHASDPTIKTIAVGQGQHLFEQDKSGPEITRGWMFRMRITIQAIVDEYKRRSEEDFIAVMADAEDVYVSESMGTDTLGILRERFLTKFAPDYDIVISTQVYCCNPWSLREIARNTWDEHYEASDGPETVYKHINAGLYMGYASAIIEMAKEMKIFETSYVRPESFDNLMQSQHFKDKAKMDMFDVDDDEWQMAVWYMEQRKNKNNKEEKTKRFPQAVLDVHQDLFAVTGTFRAQYRDGGFLLFSQDDFAGMFGTLPVAIQGDGGLAAVTQCPYHYNQDKKVWTNTITQSQPLVFHFAGSDWLCACQIFEEDGYDHIPDRFRHMCEEEYPRWRDRVNQGVQEVSKLTDPREQIFLQDDSAGEDVHLGGEVARLLQGYSNGPTADDGSSDGMVASLALAVGISCVAMTVALVV